MAEEKVVSLYVPHKKIYPKAVSGFFSSWRWVFVWLTQLVFYGLPWLNWNDRQAVLFNLEARRFYIFGLVLYPQDFIYLTALLLISAYSLFLFTAVGGRLWCGYTCPQTVYSEIFMWIERKIEGDRAARIKLDAQSWIGKKFTLKVLKQLAWIAVALFTGFSFLGYFVPIRGLAQDILALSLGPWGTFWVLFYSFATYGNAGYMREQVCKYMCPYARFQSAMFDKDTLIVTYDAKRGEPRGPRGKNVDYEQKGLGACVDCGQCVQVCPTGIDIRNGLQYECIGCAACVDACDAIMDKFGYAKGLVRYDTQNGLDQKLTWSQKLKKIFRPRILIYSAILWVIIAGVGYSMLNRMPFKADVIKDRASLARIVEDGWVENVYRLQIMNTTEEKQTYDVAVEGLNGIKLSKPLKVVLGPAEASWSIVSLQVPPEQAQQEGAGAHSVNLIITRVASNKEEERVLKEKTTFIIPR